LSDSNSDDSEKDDGPSLEICLMCVRGDHWGCTKKREQGASTDICCCNVAVFPIDPPRVLPEFDSEPVPEEQSDFDEPSDSDLDSLKPSIPSIDDNRMETGK